MKKRLAFGITLLLLIAALLVVAGMLRGAQNDNETQVLNYKDLVEQYKELTNSWLITNEDQQELATENFNLDNKNNKLIIDKETVSQELEMEKFYLDDKIKRLILENEMLSRMSSESSRLAEEMSKIETVEHMPKKIRQAIVEVIIHFRGTFADFDKFFGSPRPPVDDNEIVTHSWRTIGTVVKVESLDPRIVVARHVLFPKRDSEFELKKFLTISVAPYSGRTGYGSMEFKMIDFPDLDIVLLNAPSDLWASALPLYRFPYTFDLEVVSHLYTLYDRGGIGAKTSLASPLYSESKDVGLGTSSEDFLRLTGRFLPGDSGSPVLITKDGVTYVAGFVLWRYTGMDDDGGAVKASKLQDTLLAYQQQHQQP